MTTEIKIIIIEDNPSDTDLLHREMKKAGMVCASVVVETKEAFQRALDSFGADIILSDYSLPSFDAVTAFHIKQEKYPHIPFIIVSGVFGEERAVELIKNGVTDYVAKEHLFTLAPKIQRALKETEEKRIKIATDEKLRVQTADLINAYTQLVLQNKEKDKRAEELVIINQQLSERTEELKRAQLYQIEYSEGLERMMFITSHRVRQPVTSIMGLADMLDRAMDSPEKLNKLVKSIKESTLNLDAFTKELSLFLENLKTMDKKQAVKVIAEAVLPDTLMNQVT